MCAVKSWLISGRLKVLIIIIVVIVVASFLALHNKPPNKAAPSFLTPQVQAATQSKATQNWLKQKKYQNAAVTCTAEASADSGMGNYNAAKTALQNCIKAIPEAQVPYSLYDNLSNVAKKLGDKSLQKDSIEKALTKAQEPNSGVDPALIAFYEQELATLK